MIFVFGNANTFAQDSLFYEKALVNLAELDSSSEAASINVKVSPDFSSSFRELNFGLFSKELYEAEGYYQYLLKLPENHQKNLVLQFSLIDQYLTNEMKTSGLSPELKYLPATLSFLNNKATGDMQKAGFWQLTHFQALLNGLEVNRFIDERFNVHHSTDAALKIIQNNSDLFHSEEIAVLGFLAGNTVIQNTLAKNSSGISAEELLEQMPDETKEKVAMFQAMGVYLANNKIVNNALVAEVDTVLINRQMHLKQIAQVMNISLAELEDLNPQLRYDILPGETESTRLFLPKGKREDFTILFDSIINSVDSALFEIVAQKIEYPPAPARQYVGEKVKDLEIEGKTKITYTIQSGDVLGFIAEDYNVRVADLKYWNNIYNERKIQAGKKLYIFVDDSEAEYYKKLQPEEKVASKKKTKAPIPANAEKIEHTVKNGESPYVIAKKYDGVTPEAILDWNGITDARKIQIGQKLIIYLAQ